MKTKVCSNCKAEKTLTEFYKNRKNKTGLCSLCKECAKAYRKAWVASNKEKVAASKRAYRQANKEKIASQYCKYSQLNKDKIAERKRKYAEKNKATIAQYRKKYRAENKEKLLAQERNYREKNKAYIREKNKNYYANNKEYYAQKAKQWREQNAEKLSQQKKEYRKTSKNLIREYSRSYYKQRIQTDEIFRLKERIRGRLRSVVYRNNSRSGHAVRDLGCSVRQLKQHIESQFCDGMTWENAGTYWHVDHIFPLAAANLQDRTEFLAVNNWRNLQPLAAKENLTKGDTVTPAAQALFDSLCHELGTQENAA